MESAMSGPGDWRDDAACRDADPELFLGPDIGGKYQQALRKIGIDLGMLSSEAGHA